MIVERSSSSCPWCVVTTEVMRSLDVMSHVSLLSPLRHLALVTLSLIAVSTLTQYSSHLLSQSVSPGTHSLLYSSEHQSIKNLRPFRRVWKEKAENLPGRLQWAAGSPRPVRSHLMLSWWPGPASADCSPVPGSHYLSELDTRTEDYSDTRIGWAHSHNCTLSPGATSNLNANFELKQVAGWAPLPPVWPGQLTGWLARFLSGARIFCFINFANGQKMVFKSEWNPHEHSQLSIPAALLSIKW